MMINISKENFIFEICYNCEEFIRTKEMKYYYNIDVLTKCLKDKDTDFENLKDSMTQYFEDEDVKIFIEFSLNTIRTKYINEFYLNDIEEAKEAMTENVTISYLYSYYSHVIKEAFEDEYEQVVIFVDGSTEHFQK